MVSSRLNVAPVWHAHWRGLQDRRVNEESLQLVLRADTLARGLSIGIPIIIFTAAEAILFALVSPGWRLRPELAAAGMASAGLLFGSLLAAFALLATWRQRVAERDAFDERPLGWMIDEAVAHIMLAVLESVILVLCSIGSLVIPASTVSKICTGLGAAALAHMLFLFILVVPRLYSAYTEVNSVPMELDGFTKLRSHG